LVPVLHAFYIQGVLKFKCKIPAPKGYRLMMHGNSNIKFISYILTICVQKSRDLSFTNMKPKK